MHYSGLKNVMSIVTAAILVMGMSPVRAHQGQEHGYIAEYLTNLGIDPEVRVVADEEDEIVAALSVAGRYTYVFTTGGIGPTHDDITADWSPGFRRASMSIRARSRS